MKHLFTLGIVVLASEVRFAGVYFLKSLIGKQPSLLLTLVFVAMVLVTMKFETGFSKVVSAHTRRQP
jgi:magnesium-transporting ATPase (P-type)